MLFTYLLQSIFKTDPLSKTKLNNMCTERQSPISHKDHSTVPWRNNHPVKSSHVSYFAASSIAAAFICAS